MEGFVVVHVDYKYCDFLRKFDSRVSYNSGDKRIRPFIGVLFKVNGIEYFAPLSSPKLKHQKMKNSVDFIKIDSGKLGAINFNNMIPIIEGVYEILNLDEKKNSIKEKNYYRMLQLQLYWLNRNYNKVKNKANNLYNGYINNTLKSNVKNRCCNFLLLEEKCKEYVLNEEVLN